MQPIGEQDNPEDPDRGSHWFAVGSWVGMLFMRLATIATVCGVAGYAYKSFGG